MIASFKVTTVSFFSGFSVVFEGFGSSGFVVFVVFEDASGDSGRGGWSGSSWTGLMSSFGGSSTFSESESSDPGKEEEECGFEFGGKWGLSSLSVIMMVS